MFRKSTDTLIIAVIFVVAAQLLDTFHFWQAIGLTAPTSFVFVGLMFLTLVVVLQHALFEPFTAINSERTDQTVGKRKRADEQKTQAESILKSYEQQILAARLEAMKQRERIAMDGETQERKLVDAAKQKSQTNLEAAVAEINAEVEKARIELQSSTQPLVAQLVDEVLSIHGTAKKGDASGKSAESRI